MFGNLLRKIDVHIDQLPAFRAECVIMTRSGSVESAGAIPDADFGDVTGCFQKSKRVVDCCERDGREDILRMIEDLMGGQMVL